MFHKGDLQSGIASAIQQSKAVLCFVTDESEVSNGWCTTLCDEEEFSGFIGANAVALYIRLGSQEAGFLSSFCPIPRAPTVVVIKNGVLRENIQSTGDAVVGQQELKRRLRMALDTMQATATAASHNQMTPSTANEPAAYIGTQLPATTTSVPPAPPPERRRLSMSPDPASPSTESIRNNANDNASSPGALTGPSDIQQAQRADYVKMQRERERKQREERERIKAQIKADRTERRRLEGLRRQPAGVPPSRSDDGNTLIGTKPSGLRIQVRNFDGSTLRNIFPSTASIASDIRPWIDSFTSQTPYNLKLVLTPLPNRNIEAGEEEQSLSDLGIKGSCTIIMVPVKGYVDSYAGAGTGGLIGSAVSSGYNLVSGTAGAVLGGVKSMLGWSQSPSGLAEQARLTGQASDDEPPPAQSGSSVRIRTLADQRAEDRRHEHQLYNGNQLNFEPRKDEDKKD